MSAACIGCTRRAIATVLDLGEQPPSNRFTSTADGRQSDLHVLAVGQCEACGLLQLLAPMSPEMVKPRFDWLVYNEPESHLDALVDRCIKLPGIRKDSMILGLTYKDRSSLARFERLGFVRAACLDAAADLNVTDPLAGLESIQAAVIEGRAGAVAARRGPADLLLVRHVLEHAHQPRAFLERLLPLVRPGGYLVLEMPDSAKFLDARDYSFLWEEHVCYFTLASLEAFIQAAGFGSYEIVSYRYALEDSLVVIARRGGAPAERPPLDLNRELTRADGFGRDFPEVRDRYQRRLRNLSEAGHRMAVFGAGHLAAKFINLYEVQPYLGCVIDDHPKKQGLRMPGSQLPIRGSQAMDEIDFCLLALSPESEQKVLAAKRGFLERGGTFRSIFRLSPLALDV